MQTEETPKQEIARMERIARHLQRLSPAGRRWVYSWLRDNYGHEFVGL